MFFALGLIARCSWAINLPYLDRAKIRLSIAPGSQEFGEIIFQNPSPQARTIRLYLEDWFYAPGGDGAKSFAPPATTNRSCASWVSFSPGEFTIPANGRQKVSYKVQVPGVNNLEGGYYAVLFFESKVGELARPVEETGAGLNLVIRIGALFYTEIKGTVKRTGKIEQLSLKKEASPNRLILEADFRNSGNVDIKTGGIFHIMDKNGMVYARSEIDNVYTFPGDSARLTASWNTAKNPIPPGAYDIVLTLDLAKDLVEANLGKPQVITKEARVEFGSKGEVLRIWSPE